MLASSAHLTRTAHHNNPVENFKVVTSILSNEYSNKENEESKIKVPDVIICSGCEKQLDKYSKASKCISVCPRCTSFFCID